MLHPTGVTAHLKEYWRCVLHIATKKLTLRVISRAVLLLVKERLAFTMWKRGRSLVTQLFQGNHEPPTFSRLFLAVPRELQQTVLDLCSRGEIAALGKELWKQSTGTGTYDLIAQTSKPLYTLCLPLLYNRIDLSIHYNSKYPCKGVRMDCLDRKSDDELGPDDSEEPTMTDLLKSFHGKDCF